MRVFNSIEDDCPYWDDALDFIKRTLPNRLRLTITPDGIVTPDITFIKKIMNEVPDLHTPTIRALQVRFNWAARYLPITLPTPVEFEPLIYSRTDVQVLLAAEAILYANDEVRNALCLPTSVHVLRHALGAQPSPYPIDPDWL